MRLAGRQPYEQGGAYRQHNFYDGKENGIGKDGVDIGVAVVSVDFPEFYKLPLFGGKCLQYMHTGNMLLHKGIERGYRIAHPDKRFINALFKKLCGYNQ